MVRAPGAKLIKPVLARVISVAGWRALMTACPVKLTAALERHRLVYLTEGQIAAYLADGRLVRILANWCQPFSGYHLYYPSRRRLSCCFRGS